MEQRDGCNPGDHPHQRKQVQTGLCSNDYRHSPSALEYEEPGSVNLTRYWLALQIETNSWERIPTKDLKVSSL